MATEQIQAFKICRLCGAKSFTASALPFCPSFRIMTDGHGPVHYSLDGGTINYTFRESIRNHTGVKPNEDLQDKAIKQFTQELDMPR